LAQTQAAQGHDVYACSLVRERTAPSRRNGVSVWPLAARNPLWIADSARFPSPLRLANKTATVLNWRVASEFGMLLDDIRPDVLHTHSMVELPPTVWDQAARRGVPIVHTLHDYDLLCIRGALFKDGRKCQPRHTACRLLSARKQTLHDRIDAVGAVSRTVLDMHLDHGLFAHLPAERRQVVWNPAGLKDTGGTRPSRAEDGPLRFGFLGRLVGEKGLGPLIDACRELPRSGWTLRIAGEGGERRTFEAQAKGLPIHFLGHVEAQAFLADTDVLICAPLWDEPFGLTTLEAYAAGCRVIGSDGGVIGEVVNQIDPGWSVPPGDVAALAHAMQRAMQCGSALPPSRRPAVQTLLARLDPGRVARTYLDLYLTAGARSFARDAAQG
jgi:glycosyltransferase involved in cell wall biosynthesis